MDRHRNDAQDPWLGRQRRLRFFGLWALALSGGLPAAPLEQFGVLPWGVSPTVANARPAVSRTSAATPPLVFDGVTVIDVERGRRLRHQRVVIVGNRIQAMGSTHAVQVPAGAQVVDARGKYLIPGLWDMHMHSQRSHMHASQPAIDYFYPLSLASGVTGIRDAWTEVPIETLLQWRQEILTGTRVGPPRQLIIGSALDEDRNGVCQRAIGNGMDGHMCVTGLADARHVVDSLKGVGADMIKTYNLGRDMYFAIAAEARRVGIPFGGHLDPTVATAIEASDSGASILDHTSTSGDLGKRCLWSAASVERCRPVAEHFRRNGTWWVPTLVFWDFLKEKLPNSLANDTILRDWHELTRAFWTDSGRPFTLDLRRRPIGGAQPTLDRHHDSPSHSDPYGVRNGLLSIVRRVGLPILAGTDVMNINQDDDPYNGHGHREEIPPGLALHMELALYVVEGLTPLEALQAATLNPAKLLHGTDSLGTVAPGKLADLVLLDADPLTDITNTTAIRAVVANGRYFDRAALDQVVATARVKARQAEAWQAR